MALSMVKGKGSASARILIQVMSEHSESSAESLAMLRLWQAGLTLPTQQFWLESYTGYRYRPDMVWEEQGLILEIDGHIKFQGLYRPAHEQAGYDAMRQRELEIMGWSVMRTTWKELYEHPATPMTRLRAAGVQSAQK